MFDKVQILLKAGNGGDGAVSFRREKFVPYGGPDGGDGGNGGDAVIIADPGESSLRAFIRRRLYQASDGGNGQGKKKHGRKGKDLLLKVPLGTIVANQNGDIIIADLEKAKEQVIVVRGGRGGWGNIHFVSSTNQVPRLAQKGEVGEESGVTLELRLIADVGIIGYPNVGKSTLLAAASSAKPKVASYPFTTLEPILGMVEVSGKSFVLAEIPGLIEGAHLGRGLGHDFLRHAMRTKVLIHLIDGASSAPVDDLAQVNEEIRLFDVTLAEKPQVVAINKIDLPEVRLRLAEIKQSFHTVGIPVFPLSAATGEGVAELMAAAMKRLNQMSAEAKAGEGVTEAVFHPQPGGFVARVRKEGNAFILAVPELERIIARVDMSNPEIRQQVNRQVIRLRLNKALEKAGARPGDKIRCGNFEWEW